MRNYSRTVRAVAHVRCSGCERALVVMPAMLAEFVGADRGALTELLGELEDKHGNRYTLAEPDGAFVCPACAMPGCALSARGPAALQGTAGSNDGRRNRS
jgi:hypothetical protein